MRKAWLLPLCAPLLAGSAWLMRNDARVGEGQDAFGGGEFGRAATLFQKAMAGDGNRDVLQFNLGTALAEQGRRATDPDESARLLKLAVVALRSALDASDLHLQTSAHFNLGNTLVWSKDYEAAIEHYKSALRITPLDDDARHNLEVAQLLRDSEISLEDVEPGHGSGEAATPESGASGHPEGVGAAGTPTEGQGEGEGAGTEPGHGQGDRAKPGEAEPGEGEANAMRAEPRPMRESESLEGSGVEEKLKALERRSSELRRSRVLRRTKASRSASGKDSQ